MRQQMVTAQRKLEQQIAARILEVARAFQREHKARLGVLNPDGKTPSKPGEYLRKVTGKLQKGVILAPSTVAEVIANGFRCRVGYTDPVWYGPWWETKAAARRLGLKKTLEGFARQLGTVAATYPG